MSFSDETLAVRFGYGLPVGFGPRRPDDLGRSLQSFDDAQENWPLPGLPTYVGMRTNTKLLQKLARVRLLSQDTYDATLNAMRDMTKLGYRTDFARALDTATPLRERLIAFFNDHFTVSARAVQIDQYRPVILSEDAIRPHIGGRFVDMLKAVTLHPSMLLYLDQPSSVGPNSVVGKKLGKGLNENLAREVMELHTLGVAGGYVQADVRALAELLTGITVDREFAVGFDKNRAEPGQKVVLGRKYQGGSLEQIEQNLEDLAQDPATAAHLCRKLAVHFLSDTPDQDVIDAMQHAFLASGGDIPAIMTAMLSHAAAATPQPQKARQPFDFITAACRALGVTGGQIIAMPDKDFTRIFVEPARLMGQKLKAPRGPDGWPEEAHAWITPQFMAARIDWAMTAPQKLVPILPDPVAFAKTALGSRASTALLSAVSRAEDRRAGVGIVLASPEFNRR